MNEPASDRANSERTRDAGDGGSVKRLLLGVLLIGLVAGAGTFAFHLTQPVTTVDVLVIDAALAPHAGAGTLVIDEERSDRRSTTLELSARRRARATLPEFTLVPQPFDPEFDDEDDRLAPSLRAFDPVELVTAIPGARRPSDPTAARLDEFLTSESEISVRGLVGRGVFEEGEAPALWLIVAHVRSEHPSGIVARAIGRDGELVPYEMILRAPRVREQSPWLRLITRRTVREHRLELQFAPARR